MHRDPLHAQRLFERSLDLLTVLDPELRILHANPAWKRVLGREPASVVGRDMEDLLHPDDVEHAMRAVEGLRGDDRSMAVDTRLLHADGSVRCVRWSARSHPGDSLIYAAGRDITTEVAVQRQLRAGERRLAEAERMAGIGAIEWSPEDDWVAWSDGMYRLYGLPPGSPPLTPEQLLARMRAGEAEHARAVVGRAIAERSSYEVDFHIIDAQGRLRELTARGEASVERGEVRVRGAVQDVTEARRKSHQQEEIARLGQLALAGTDRDALFREVCAAVSRTLDTPRSDVIVLQPDGAVVAVAGIGWPADDPPRYVAAGQPSLTAWAAETGRPMIVEDWKAERRFTYPDTLREASLRCSAVLTIPGRDRPFGALATHAREPGFLRQDDLAFLEALAAFLATAIERFRSEEEIAALAKLRGRLVAESVEAEERVRRRIADDLHDRVLQDLLAARQDLIEAAGGGAAADGMVASARDGVERAVAQLRDAVHALHPVVLEHGGLLAALQAAAEQAGRQAGFATDVAVSPEATGARDRLVLSVARELLANAGQARGGVAGAGHGLARGRHGRARGRRRRPRDRPGGGRDRTAARAHRARRDRAARRGDRRDVRGPARVGPRGDDRAGGRAGGVKATARSLGDPAPRHGSATIRTSRSTA